MTKKEKMKDSLEEQNSDTQTVADDSSPEFDEFGDNEKGSEEEPEEEYD